MTHAQQNTRLTHSPPPTRSQSLPLPLRAPQQQQHRHHPTADAPWQQQRQQRPSVKAQARLSPCQPLPHTPFFVCCCSCTPPQHPQQQHQDDGATQGAGSQCQEQHQLQRSGHSRQGTRTQGCQHGHRLCFQVLLPRHVLLPQAGDTAHAHRVSACACVGAVLSA